MNEKKDLVFMKDLTVDEIKAKCKDGTILDVVVTSFDECRMVNGDMFDDIELSMKWCNKWHKVYMNDIIKQNKQISKQIGF